MGHLRLNPLTGRWVTIASERAERPEAFARQFLPIEADPDRPCPFCPGHEEDAALETSGPTGGWAVRVVANKFPAFSGSDAMHVDNLGPVFRQAPSSGIHEVLILSPSHDNEFGDLDDAQVGLVMAALRDRLAAHADQPGIRYSQAIVNHGREAGASLHHPHGQLLGIPFVPGEVADEEAGFRRFQGSCLICTTIQAELDAGFRVVAESDDAVLLCPFWSGVPFEMLAMPKHHEGHLRNADTTAFDGVGVLLRDGIRTLRRTIGDLPYNLVVHTLPHHHDNEFHWHIHLVPRISSAVGFEQGTGVQINIVGPETAAELLRA